MKKAEQADAAVVLKALTKGWSLVDADNDVDFLIFVNEDRDELDFYPKKSFIQMLEHAGLIEDKEKERSTVREPFTHYEGTGSGWNEITEAGSILFWYWLTPEGQRFLRDAPKLTGAPIRQLKAAASPIEIPPKRLKVVTYDRQAIQKLIDEFVQKAMKLIEAELASNGDGDVSVSSTGVLLCGPKLWRRLESQATLNGLRPAGRLVSSTYSLTGGVEKTTTTPLQERLLSGGEVRLFWRTLRETFKLDGPPLIGRAALAEASGYPFQRELRDDDLPAPNLAELAIMFIVEANQSKFMVMVKNQPLADFKHFSPDIHWIELVQGH